MAELERWCDAILGVELDLSARVKVFDANDLARFVNHHRVSLPQDLERVLGIEGPKGFFDWHTWYARFESDRGTERGIPTFELDDDRRRKLEDIYALATPERAIPGPRYTWIAGPPGMPGMGKTRLVIEALSRVPDHDRRALFTEDPDAAVHAFISPWFGSVDDAIVVVDECSDARVDELITIFGARNGARHDSLILIGPLPESYDEPRQRPSALARRMRS